MAQRLLPLLNLSKKLNNKPDNKLNNKPNNKTAEPDP
tara:strand:+ start:592 stop:702 length:111 start_codon:yes stop_codon:yes gene_type:complete